MSSIAWTLPEQFFGLSDWRDKRVPDRPATTTPEWAQWVGPAKEPPQVTLLGTDDAAPWVPEVLAKVGELTALRPGWDGASGCPLSASAVRAAVSFMNRKLSNSTVAPQIVPTRAGGLQMEWHSRGIDLEIEVDHNGRLLAYVEGLSFLQEGWEGPLDWRGQHYVEQALKLLS